MIPSRDCTDETTAVGLLDPAVEALDPRQVERIGAVHRGFLYQHLYAVACLLTIGRTDGAKIVVERDEDSEVLSEGQWIYTQAKMRG